MKILIVYAKAGAGHRRAAEAVYSAFKRRGQQQDAVLVDCLDYTQPWFKDFYPQAYLSLVRFLPFLWKGIYYALENRTFYSLFRPLRHWNNCLVAQGFADLLKQERPQVVVSTQFFASEVVAGLKKTRQIDSTLISVITDFGAHTFWESEDVDVFVVASEDTKQDLISRNIPEQKIRVLGIPIEPPLKEFNQQSLLQEIGLKGNRFTVLIVGGGFGVGPIKELVFSLEQLSEQIRDKAQLIVVCSRNQKLLVQLEAVASRLKMDIKIFGFVDDLYKMMAASDVLISKSGGLTTSEALGQGLPMIIIAPIPGQETKNCELLVKNGAAIRIDQPFQIKETIEELIKMPDSLQRMRKNALRLARPNSADDIVNLINNV